MIRTTTTRRAHPISLRRALLPLACLLACAPRPLPEASTGTTGPAETSSTTPPTTSIADETTATSTSLADTTGTSLPDVTTGSPGAPDLLPPQCDGFKQLEPECPTGQKCTINGSEEFTHCVEIPEDPKGMYEPCTVQGAPQSGLDDCDLGLVCWDVDTRGHGTCIGLCDGDASRCTCIDPKVYYPHISGAGVVGLCFPGCDPFLQDCSEDEVCVPNGEGFLCVPDFSGDAGAVNDPCEFASACDKGLVCINTPGASSACMQNTQGCCQPFCNFAKMEPCPNPDQACVPWYDPMNPMMIPPPGLEELGVCAIPS